MRTLWLNSKKCSTVDLGVIAAVLCLIAPAFAAVPSPLEKQLRSELHVWKGDTTHALSFEPLIRDWERRYASQPSGLINAASALVSIASDTAVTDTERYIAALSAARIGGKSAGPRLLPLLKDRSWLIRSAALESLATAQNQETGPSVIPLLRDPAMAVRFKAVETVEALHPMGAAAALSAMLADPANYVRGKAMWVPGRALDALVRMGAKSETPKITALLSRKIDPELKAKVLLALKELRAVK